MGLFGLFGHGKKKEAAIIPAAAQEEPEFLKKIDIEAAKEVEAEQQAGEGAGTAASVKEEVEPELALWLNNGATVKSLKELAAALKKMKAADYKEHANEERNDIAEWVKEILNNDELARQLRKAKGRIQAARYAEKEILNLKAARRKAEIAAKTAAKAEKKAGKEAAKPAQKPAKAAGKIETKLKTAAKIKQLKPLEEEETETWKEMPKEAPIEEFGTESNEGLGEELKLKLPEIQISAAAEIKEGAEVKHIAKPRRWFWPFKKQSPGEAEQAVPEAPEVPKIPDRELSMPELFAEEHSEAQTGKQDNQGDGDGIAQKEDVVPELPSLEDLGEIGEEFGVQKTPRAGMGEFRLSKAGRDKKAEAEPAELEPHYAQWAEASGELKERKAKGETEEVIGEEIAELPASAAESDVGEAVEGAKRARARERKSPEEAELDRKEDELDRQEKELSNEEAELNANKLGITRKRYELIKQKGEIERKKFEVFMKKHRLTAQMQEASLTELAGQQWDVPEFAQELKGMPDLRLGGEYGKERLQALLEEAKQHIHQNNVEEAQKALEQAQSVFNTVYMPLNEKKQMEYEILEVEADLKLASLN